MWNYEETATSRLMYLLFLGELDIIDNIESFFG